MRFLLFFLLLIFYQVVNAQDVNKYIKQLNTIIDDSSRVELLNDIGDMYKDTSTDMAMRYYKKALRLSEKNKNIYGQAKSHLNIGMLCNDSTALEELTIGLKIAKQTSDKLMIIRFLTKIGDIYSFWNKNLVAIDHYFEALKYADELGDEKYITSIYLSLGNVYYDLEDRDNALKYFELAKKKAEITKDTVILIYALNNIGNVYYTHGEYDKALDYYELSLEKNKNIEDPQGKTAALSNMGYINLELGNYKKAMEYFNGSQKYAKRINSIEYIIKNYLGISKAYERMGIYKSSLKKYKEYSHFKDSVFTQEKHKQIAKMQARYNSEKNQRKIELLEHTQQIDRMQFYAIGTALLLFIVVGIFIYSRQKGKLKKDRELMEKNKLIHEAQKKLVEIEKKEKNRLKDELKSKNMELTNFALHIIHKNELIQDIKNAVKDLKSKDGTERSKHINEIMIKLNQNLKTNNELQEFQQHVEKVNFDYFYHLNQKFPNLTENEKRLSALLRLNLSSKEIASLNNISVKAVEMGRYRLRKKLGLSKSDSLSRFLQQL